MTSGVRCFLRFRLVVALWILGACAVPPPEDQAVTRPDLREEAKEMTLRICRYLRDGRPAVAFYFDDRLVDLQRLYDHYVREGGSPLGSLLDWEDPLAFLALGRHAALARRLRSFFEQLDGKVQETLSIPVSTVQLLPPLAPTGKFFLLAGNYAEHIEEGGGVAEEREHTFPYVFWKPPSTTFRGSEAEVVLPAISPDAIDWEVELGVVIGRQCKGVPAEHALTCVTGYTVVNDISNRRFRPNPNRRERAWDAFFDWLHGKWFDGFAPVGPAILSAEELSDPQTLRLQLRVNGTVHQDSNTERMIFGVAEVIEFISSFVTLEPGDLISSGTPSGVGAAKGVFLSPGDLVEAEIEKIGVLRSRIVEE